ncbi:MAG: YceI family protein [Bacteroidota bacterium]
MKRNFFVIFATLLVTTTAFADSGGWSIDQAHSSITFSVQHMVISEVTGTFRDFNITFVSSKDDFTDATISAAIAVKSIDTGNDRRDGHLKTDDFFNAEKFPEIKFQSTSIEKIGNGHYKIKGNLTIRDTTKEVTIDAVLNGVIPSGKGLRAGWRATLAVNRFDYGLKWDRTIETGGLVAGATVNLVFNLEFVKQ